MASKAEIKVEKADVFDSKLDAGAKKAAKSAGDDAAKSTVLEAAYVIQLTPKLVLDEKAGEIVATCSWLIYEGGGSKLFARLKQSRASTARAKVNPAKIGQGDLDDTIGAVVSNEVSAIVKALKSLK